ncbi:hypothetical protein EV207_10543 [Scopulibacillus darangshiensis]|uniref:Uncharacterized protein n=1 Tax=Scopulibacillus darangshiensis TaxID=442528 RepID=A0A4R2P8E5_9BACL|nr:DUF5325 family protein [Scopulibacillus darangshiensis]TCP30514.1 hypothetical protein EV207_10543 [Scopulibacillus darangshiensis]
MNIILLFMAVLVIACLVAIGGAVAYGSAIGVILAIIGACVFMGLGFVIRSKMSS